MRRKGTVEGYGNCADRSADKVGLDGLPLLALCEHEPPLKAFPSGRSKELIAIDGLPVVLRTGHLKSWHRRHEISVSAVRRAATEPSTAIVTEAGRQAPEQPRALVQRSGPLHSKGGIEGGRGSEVIRAERRGGMTMAGREELRTVLDLLRWGDVLMVTTHWSPRPQHWRERHRRTIKARGAAQKATE